MPRGTIPTVTADQAVRASWGNQVKANDEDHETRVLALEAAGGTGDVVGPATATDNAIARWDGTTGNLAQNSGITIADSASGTLSGTNSGDVTLAGTPNYLTIAAQVLTRALIDLASHVTGRLPWANVVQVTANRLIGRVGSLGDAQEIAIGAGLILDGSGLRATGSAGSVALDDLTDVTITTPATNHVLSYNGAWVNTATPELTRVGVGVAADANVKLKVDGQYGSLAEDLGSSGTSKTINWHDGNTQLLTLTGNCTLTLSNPQDGFRYLLALEQDGTGSRTVTWPSAVKWKAGTAPTLSTTAGKVDLITLVYFSGLGASGNYLASFTTDFTPA